MALRHQAIVKTRILVYEESRHGTYIARFGGEDASPRAPDRSRRARGRDRRYTQGQARRRPRELRRVRASQGDPRRAEQPRADAADPQQQAVLRRGRTGAVVRAWHWLATQGAATW